MTVARGCGERGTALELQQALGLGLVPPFSLGARGNRAWAAGGPEAHNVLLKKVRLQLAGSIKLSLVGVPAHSSLSQVFLQVGWVGPPPSSPLPFSLMVTSQQ